MTLFLLALICAAPASDASLSERLLGPEPPSADATAQIEGGPDLPLGAIAAAGLALVGLGALQRRRSTRAPDLALSVVGHTALPGGGGISVVEIDDAGERRRFVIGTGAKPPVLLAELDDPGSPDLHLVAAREGAL